MPARKVFDKKEKASVFDRAENSAFSEIQTELLKLLSAASALQTGNRSAVDSEKAADGSNKTGSDSNKKTVGSEKTAADSEKTISGSNKIACSCRIPEISGFSLPSSHWQEIIKELKSQTVDGYPADLVEYLELPEEEKAAYAADTASNLQSFYTILYEQEAVISILMDAGIRAAVLKGTAAAIYYPRPENRRMGDIDIIVLEEDFPKAETLLREKQYQPLDEDSDYERHHAFLSLSGIEIELHRWFSTSGDDLQNEILDRYVRDGLQSIRTAEINGFTFSMLPPLENGLVLLAHINQHLSSGLGLRQILDWMMYTEAVLDDTFWDKSFCQAAAALGMKKLAETVTLLGKEYLGLAASVSWCDKAEKDLAEELMRYILNKGNFGNKDRESNTTKSIMHNFIDPVSAFRYLTDAGMWNWKAAKKYKILKYFAWIYQIGHLLRKGLQRRKSPAVFLKESRQSRKELELLKRLQVTSI